MSIRSYIGGLALVAAAALVFASPAIALDTEPIFGPTSQQMLLVDKLDANMFVAPVPDAAITMAAVSTSDSIDPADAGNDFYGLGLLAPFLLDGPEVPGAVGDSGNGSST